MALTALAQTLGWLGDLFAVHLYRDDAPLPMRRRISFDGDGLDVQDDLDDEVSRVSLTVAGAGDSGTVPSPSVANTILASVDGSAVGWTDIVNAMVDAAAAIAGTKIAPDFGAQNIVTTGRAELGATPRASVGQVRLPNNTGIYWRNAGNTQNIPIRVTAGDALIMGEQASVTQLTNASGETFELNPGEAVLRVSGTDVLETDGDDITLENSSDAAVFLGADIYRMRLDGAVRHEYGLDSDTQNLSGNIRVFRQSFSATLIGGSGIGNVHTFTPAADGEYIVSVDVLARDTGTDRNAYQRVAAFRRVAGTVQIIGAVAAPFTAEDEATWDFTIDAAANVIRLRGTPDGANDTTFAGVMTITSRA